MGATMFMFGKMKVLIISVYIFVLTQYRMFRCFVRTIGRPIKIGKTTNLSKYAVLRVHGAGSITIGQNCEIHDYAMILTYGGRIVIGDNCSINPFTIIYGAGNTVIGNGVRIAAHTVVIPANHNPGSDEVPIHKAGVTRQGITIEDGVWIGAGCQILDGVRIGRNAVVGAGSVVTRLVPENATVVGVPARVVKQR